MVSRKDPHPANPGSQYLYYPRFLKISLIAVLTNLCTTIKKPIVGFLIHYSGLVCTVILLRILSGRHECFMRNTTSRNSEPANCITHSAIPIRRPVKIIMKDLLHIWRKELFIGLVQKMRTLWIITCFFILILAHLLITGCTNITGPSPSITTPTPQIIYVTVIVTPTGKITPFVTPTKATPSPTSVYTGLVLTSSKKSNQVILDETYVAQYNNWYCTDVQEAIGQPYLYPDETYKMTVSSSASTRGGHTNILLLQDNDYQLFKTISPRWDDLNKKFVYDGIVPIVLFSDVMSQRSKLFSVKTTGKYYICLDDRQYSSEGFKLQTSAPAFEAYVKLIKNPA